jgi:hypothetical protein
LADQFPQLKALIETRHPKSNKGRMILIGVILVAGLLAAASKSGKYTLPFMIMVLVVIFFFKRFERFFSGSETAWRNFRDNIEGKPLEPQLPVIEEELTGDTTEWSLVLMTESFILWPRDIEVGRIVSTSDITRVYLDEGEDVRLLCDTRMSGDQLVLSTIGIEIEEIVNELGSRNANFQIDPALLARIGTEPNEDIT